MTGLLRIGKPPEISRSPGRKKGKWRGHEQMADELRTLASRERDPANRWGVLAERLSSTKSQSIASAVKKGEAIGFEHRPGKGGGHFEALTRKSEDQSSRDSKGRVQYEVWARWVPTE